MPLSDVEVAPASTPFATRRKGVNPDWGNLPRRKCDNCGAGYKPTRPLRSIDKYGFCKPDCKKSFHKNGGAYRKLKGEIEKLISRRLRGVVREELERILAHSEIDISEERAGRKRKLSARLVLY